MKAQRRALVMLAAIALLVVPSAVPAQLAVSSNDNKVMLDNGVNRMVPNAPPDTVSIIDLKISPPRVIAEIAVPGSVVGPPLSVALTPDESLALVTSSTKIDPNDPAKGVPDNRVSGFDLNRQGTLALVANRSEGTVSVYTIQGKTVTPAGKVTIADEKSGTSHATFTPDGKMALVSRDGDHKISVLSIDGTKVEYTKRDINAGLRPYGIDVSSKGDFAAVANIGIGQGDTDTVSLIDVRAKPPRVVDTISVGQTLEGVKVSPDGSVIAVVVMNGSNKGHWSQGAAFVFSWDGSSLKEIGRLKVNGGPAAVRTAEK